MTIPLEIQNHILEFNADHRPCFDKCQKRIHCFQILKQILLEGCFSRLHYIIKLFDTSAHENNWNFEAILRNTISDPDYFIKSLNTCKCCTIHQQHRPNTLE